jgi:hypothetical protein
MDSQYNITISVKTPGGMLGIGNFFIGNDSDFAHTTFNNLKGNKDEQGMLRVDLTEKPPKPYPGKRLKSITCSLDQYVENCRIITRDAFKFFTMECKNLKPRYSINSIMGRNSNVRPHPPLVSNFPQLNAIL